MGKLDEVNEFARATLDKLEGIKKKLGLKINSIIFGLLENNYLHCHREMCVKSTLDTAYSTE